jgi:hypothetical protein
MFSSPAGEQRGEELPDSAGARRSYGAVIGTSGSRSGPLSPHLRAAPTRIDAPGLACTPRPPLPGARRGPASGPSAMATAKARSRRTADGTSRSSSPYSPAMSAQSVSARRGSGGVAGGDADLVLVGAGPTPCGPGPPGSPAASTRVARRTSGSSRRASGPSASDSSSMERPVRTQHLASPHPYGDRLGGRPQPSAGSATAGRRDGMRVPRSSSGAGPCHMTSPPHGPPQGGW